MNDNWFCVETINKILKKYHKPLLTLEKYLNIFDFPVKDYYQKIGFDFSEHPFEIVGTEFIQEYRKQWQKCKLHKDAEQVLTAILTAGLTQSVVSAADSDLLNAFIAHYNVPNYFTCWLGLNHHYATGKVDIARQFMKQSDFDPTEVLMVGDTNHDFSVAKEINVDCILFTKGHQTAAKLAECDVPLISSLAEVLRFVDTGIKFMF